MAQLFTDSTSALAAVDAKSHQYVDFECPYQPSRKACGSWCALYESATHTRDKDGAELTKVIPQCGSGNRPFLAKVGSAPGG